MKSILFFLALALGFIPASAQTIPPHSKTGDVVYGRKFGVALTMDVFRPEKPNGFGIVYMVSGGWVSGYSPNTPPFYAPFLERGYTVFSVRHGCQPKFIISEIFEDIHRAVRFIRHNAAQWQIDPAKLGISGASAGGHLSLTMGVRGSPGAADARDRVDRQDSSVQAIACLFPPTDFLNYGKPGEDAVGVGILARFQPAFGPESLTAEGRQRLGKELSPIYHLSAKLPPTLIIHGDKDDLVPIQQAQSFVDRARELGATAELVTKPGAAHGWPDRIPEYQRMAEWFDRHLRGLSE